MIRVDAWFCKCHAYNPVVVLELNLVGTLPKKVLAHCEECSKTQLVGIKGKEII